MRACGSHTWIDKIQGVLGRARESNCRLEIKGGSHDGTNLQKVQAHRGKDILFWNIVASGFPTG